MNSSYLRLRPLALAASAALVLAPLAANAATSSGDGPVSVDTSYVKANGRSVTPSDAISRCGSNRRQQNEPTSAVDPTQQSVVTSGSNDYCTVELAGGTWTGFYRSTDSGRTWTDSLLPGYPTDNSPEGVASPLHQAGIQNAGDPVQAWDLHGRLFYMGNAFNRAAPQNGSVWVATYDGHADHYVRTVIVAKGTPALSGKFNDKTAIEVDRSASRYEGSIYTAVSVFQGQGNNEIKFSRSTDHGATFSNPVRISETSPGNQFADITVASNGDVYVVWNGVVGTRPKSHDAMLFVKSTDGGKHFTKPRVAADFAGFDAADSYGDGAAAGRAHEQAFENADGPESEVDELSAGDARDCGSGPNRCQSGFTFFRHSSSPHVTADPKGDPNTLWMAYDATIPSTITPSTSTYNTAPVGPDGSLRVGQGAIYLTKSVNGGASWSTPTLLAPEPAGRGHQLFPDINADGGRIFAIWHDSRNDRAYSVQNPPGNDSARDAQGFHLATPGLDTYGASSTDGGASWSQARLSTQTQMPNYEMFGNRTVPFHGDYNYVSSVNGFAYGTWTDTRQVVPGDDPRYSGGEGFDVAQCRAADGTDQCPDAGGLDQDIFGAGFTP